MTTEIYLDGVRIEYEDAAGDSTVKDLVDVVEKELLRAGRCIREIWMDGEMAPEWRSETVLGERISKHRELNIKTVSIEALALDGIDIIREYLRFINENIPSCSTDLRMGRPSADKLLAAIFEGLVEVMKTADALNVGAGRCRLDLFGEDPSGCFKLLAERLEELNAARLSGDAVLTGDILEYELVPLITDMAHRVFGRRCA